MMIKNVIISPISGASDADEELVLALAAHLGPIMPEWRKGLKLRARASELQTSLPILQQEADSFAKQVRDLDQKITEALEKFKAFRNFIIFVGVLVSVAGGFLYNPWMFLAGLPIMLLGPQLAAKGRGEKELMVDLRAKAQADMLDCQQRAEKASRSLKKVEQELDERDQNFPLVTQAKVAFSIVAKDIVGESVLFDESNVLPMSNLATIDLSEIGNDLDEIAVKLARIQEVPILLAPKCSERAEGEAITTLFGEEEDIEILVNDVSRSMSKVGEVSLSVPLLEKRSTTAQQLLIGKLVNFNYEDHEVKQILPKIEDTRHIEDFVTHVNNTREWGTQVLDNFRATFDDISHTCNLYATMRSNSLQNLHEELKDVFKRSSWCSKRFYCPRTIQSPEYIYNQTEVRPKDAHALPYDTLMGRLKGDHIIAARLSADPSLDDQLYICHQAIHQFEKILHVEGFSEGMGASDRAAHMDDQYHELLKSFRNILNKVLFGSVKPVLNFSREAQVYFDPETGIWESETVPYKYSSDEVIQYGQMLKVTSDLMIPLWEHLWTEKSDFVKAELFRTNESLIRMGEKESEKLIEIANQFRSDMRSVRENIYHLESDLHSKVEEINVFRGGMEVLGLLSARQEEFLSGDKMRNIGLSDQSFLRKAEEFETYLGIEPKVQAARRGTADDPIGLIREPDLLIPYRNKGTKQISAP